jgi:penicillin-binding protein 1C
MKLGKGKLVRSYPRSRRTTAVVILLLVILWICLPKPPLMEGVSFSHQILDRRGRLLRVTLSADQKFRLFTPLANISPELIQATELQEDRYYNYHPGINPVAAVRCAWRFCWGGGYSRAGASTLSMQLARLRFGLRTRTLHGKLWQMFRALQLERHYTKGQLLEAYFNLAPYGRNVEGVGAASCLYFNKSPAALTRPEAVALSVIPQSPTRRAPLMDRENPALTAAQNRLFDRLISERSEQADALGKEFRAMAAPRTFLAPHFASQMVQSLASGNPDMCRIETTLDLDLQRMLERRIDNYLAANTQSGFVNAAAMLVDCKSMEVLAQVGSADFFNAAIDGQVDGTQRPRSPGSALKPFIYALALDQGLIHPFSLVTDARRRFGGYNPENFDREFAGPLTAADALARSRNVPAVALAAQLIRPTLYEFLQGSGVRLPREESYYGLALPLGGAEVTMEDILRLYAMLANNGRLQPLRRLVSDVSSARSKVLQPISPEAAFLTLEMLGRVPAPGLNETDPAFPVFWKTGTSHGFRDAWSAAVFDHYALAVWVGRFDGRGNASFVGRTAAGPLLFSIIDALRAAGVAKPSSHEPPPGANLRRVELCAVSGQLPTALCRRRMQGWFIPGVSPICACGIHREILIDEATGLRVATDDGARALRREVYEFWPADLRALFRQAGLPRRVPPPFLPDAVGADAAIRAVSNLGGQLRILSPHSDVVYQLRADDPADRAPVLQAQTEADATRVYWFAGKDFLGSCAPQETLSWRGKPGVWRLTALDDQGRADSCTVSLQARP